MPAEQQTKVAILHYACYPVVGGVESIMLTHARLLQEEGCLPYIIVGRGDPHSLGIDGLIAPELDSRHPEILRVQNALLAGEEWAAPAFEEWVDRICDILKHALDDTSACVVHNAFTLHKNLALSTALARMAEQGSGPHRWVAWCHDLAWTNPLYADQLRPSWPWTLLKTRLPNVTYVAISELRREEMAELFNVPITSIEIVPNGIDPASFLPCSPQMLDIQRQLRWYERDWVFLSPVRVTRRKNLELAIEVTAAVRDKGCDPLLVITGPPGPHNVQSDVYLNELLQRREVLGMERHVSFLALEGNDGIGMDVSDVLMTELYAWSDALLLTSVQEGFGLPILEAGLVRLPVFCSDIPVLREVGGGHAHYFHPSDDPASIAETMLRYLHKPGVAALRRKVLQDYTWEGIFRSRFLPLVSET